MKKLFILFVLITMPMFAFADAVEIDGIYYNLVSKGNIAEVTSHPQKYKGTVVIPDSVEFENTKYSVTAIGERAFWYCDRLTSISIPSSITKISYEVFNGCSYLTEVRISDLESWCNISFYSSPYNYHLYLNDAEVTNLVIPESITTIGNNVFCGCAWITSVFIHDGVTSIGDRAFCGCYNLSSINVPASVTSISGAFGDCRSLSAITLPQGIKGIETGTFSGCTSLLSIDIPNSVEYIGMFAFEGCSSLQSVTLSNELYSIDDGAFMNCASLDSVAIPDKVYRLGIAGDGVFEGCTSLKVVKLGKKVSSLGRRAFANCPALEDFYSYAESVPSLDHGGNFYGSYIESATLHVPESLINNYRTAEVWKEFGKIVAIEGMGDKQKCATPTITFVDSKLSFSCATDDVVFVSDISDSDIKTHYEAIVPLSVTYNISVYATKNGYEDSEVVTATLCWLDAEPKTEGITDGIASVRAKPVLIQSNGNVLNIIGTDAGAPINVYDLSGKLVGSANSTSESTSVTTSLSKGQIGIVKIGEKAVKIIVK